MFLISGTSRVHAKPADLGLLGTCHYLHTMYICRMIISYVQAHGFELQS